MGFCFLYGSRGGGSSGGSEGSQFNLILDGSTPENAAEGSISVNPASFADGAQASGKYIFSDTEPVGEEGLLWFQTGTEGLSVAMDSPMPIRMGLRSAKLYHGSIWDDVAASAWADSAWRAFSYGSDGIPEIVPWATGTSAQIARMVAAMDAGKISVEDSGWQVGDIRQVQLNSVRSLYANDRTIASQTIELVLGNAGGKTLENGKKCHFVVLQRNCLQEDLPINLSQTNAGGWRDCRFRMWCNDRYFAAFPKELQPIFKRFRNTTGDSSGLQETIDLFALASEGEVFGTRKYSYADEFAVQTQFEWYKTAANLKKTYSNREIGWFTRSPDPGTTEKFAGVERAKPVTVYANGNYGISPFGCI